MAPAQGKHKDRDWEKSKCAGTAAESVVETCSAELHRASGGTALEWIKTPTPYRQLLSYLGPRVMDLQ